MKKFEKKFDKSMKVFRKEFNELRDRNLQVVTRAEVLTDLMRSKITKNNYRLFLS